MAQATLTINSKNYGAWSLRGWLLCKLAGLDFEEHVLANDDPDTPRSCCCSRRRSSCRACCTRA